jgi:hypothetical protein
MVKKPTTEPDTAPVTDAGLPQPETASEPAPTVVVTALQAGRWRAGRQFGRDPVSIPAEDLTESEFTALKDDPLLSVQVVGAPY